MPRSFREPQPDQVDGFALALSNKLLPVVPDEAPQLLPGWTAGQQANHAIFGLVASFPVFFLLVAFGVPALRSAGASQFAAAASVGGFGLIALITFGLFWNRAGEKNLREFHAGYSTLTLTAGSFWIGRGPSWRHVPWDYTGLWQLSNDGSVKQSPDRTAIPPGIYPSPHRAGCWECWTGVEWVNHFRRRPLSA